MKEKTSPYFHHMIEHINWTWKKKKGFGYPFAGRNFKELKNMTRNYPEWYLMALWDIYIETDTNEYINETGHSIPVFLNCICWLVDTPNWKMRAREYEKKIAPLPKGIEEVIKNNVA